MKDMKKANALLILAIIFTILASAFLIWAQLRIKHNEEEMVKDKARTKAIEIKLNKKQ